ncbi:ThiF family adenylyltransferase [Okibacterium fritillariae]|uniref:Adenylyltransferase and sulfurtransferase n=1 Tax=Okibacterium fritillariae TaxID=123320 RepID=A0A1T5KCM5_9MICO|nr:ThiF family adenylyltransferase [Okibacterium fritillariae]SKC61424.1 adenylyltransferase and sulfurtransferase [Okibacterium fritillariae]
MNSLPPLVEPGPALSPAQLERFSRHVALPGLGLTGQRRLANARVLVVGAGGLGSPVLHYLTAAGIGTLGVLDDDTVDVSNLQRQVIHSTATVGMPKAESAARAMCAINPDVRVEVHPVRLTPENALDLFARYDVIVDGTDNFFTRYLANDTAAVLGKPYVWGSVLRYDAQVSVFWQGAPDGRSLDYRDLLPIPPNDDDVLSCSDAGVLGAVCGLVGSMMATETIKLVAGVGDVLLGRVQNFDALAGTWREFELRRDAARRPITLDEWHERWGDAATGSSADRAAVDSTVPLIEPRELATLLRDPDAGVELVDVRQPFERDIVSIAGSTWLDPEAPVEGLRRRGVDAATPVVVLCKSGVRSARAVWELREHGVDARSLRGGILAWVDEVEPELPRY